MLVRMLYVFVVDSRSARCAIVMHIVVSYHAAIARMIVEMTQFSYMILCVHTAYDLRSFTTDISPHTFFIYIFLQELSFS